MTHLNLLFYSACFFLAPFWTRAQEVNAEHISIACGNHYFSFTGTSQPPLIVMGKWCGDSYFYVPINIGDTLIEAAYLGDQMFDGKAIAYDSTGKALATYTFKEGYMEELIEFMGEDTLRYALHFKKGIPDGSHRSYNWEGELSMEMTYKQGILDGNYFRRYDLTDYGLPPCIETGVYHMGTMERSSEPCKWGD